MSKLGVQVDSDLVAEIILRGGDVEAVTHRVLWDFLERTANDPNVWERPVSGRFETKAEEEVLREFKIKFGDPEDGFQWGPVMLWNGTRIRMTYKGKNHYADVRKGQIVYREASCTPGKLTKEITGSNRNAWRDLWIMTPNAKEWVLADEERQRSKKVKALTIDEILG